MPQTPRYRIKKATHGGWYVVDTRDGAMWPGLTEPGARQLADHLNRRPA